MKGGFQLVKFLEYNKCHLDTECANKSEIMDILHDRLKNFSLVEVNPKRFILKNNETGYTYSLSYSYSEDLKFSQIHFEPIDGTKISNKLNDSFSLTWNESKIDLKTTIDNKNDIVVCLDLSIFKENENLKYIYDLKALDRKQVVEDLYGKNPMIINSSDYDNYEKVLIGFSNEFSLQIQQVDVVSNKKVDEHLFTRNLPIYTTLQKYIKDMNLIQQMSEVVRNDFIIPSEVSFKK